MAPSLNHPGTVSAAAEFLFVGIYVLAVLYAPRHALALRLIGLASLAGVSWALGDALMSLTDIPQWRATMTTFCGIQLLNASEILCVFRVDAKSVAAQFGHRPSSPSSNGSIARKVTAGSDQVLETASLAAKTIGLLWNLRRIGTQWEVKRVAPTRRESRVRFLLRRVSLTLLAYCVLEFLLLQPPPERAFVAPGKETLFDWSRLTKEDVIFRVGATLGMGLSVSLMNLILANVANITMVAVGASRPEECPTLNGSVTEAYTVRNFWGSVWQQGLQRPLAGHANAIVNAVLPRGSLLSRMSRLLLAFFISGLLHVLTDVGLGVRSGESGAVLFFCLQPLGIMIEEAAQTTLGGSLPAFVRKMVGYAWVIAFMTWSVPVWSFPHLRLGMKAADMLPVRILAPVAQVLTKF